VVSGDENVFRQDYRIIRIYRILKIKESCEILFEIKFEAKARKEKR
jgi:hypothetical protein